MMRQFLRIDPESELSKRLEEAAAEERPLRIVSGNAVYDIQVHEQQANLITAPRLDPSLVQRGLARSAGALLGVDLAALKEELRDARGQESDGRSA